VVCGNSCLVGGEKGSEYVKRLLGLILCAILIFSMLKTANAVSYSDQFMPYFNGASFSFDVILADLSSGPGSFLIEAEGDYSVSKPTLEYLTWDIDGLISDTAAPDNGIVIKEYSTNEVDWSKTITINETVLANISSDLEFNITLTTSPDVDIKAATYHYVKWTLTYSEMAPVPEPSTWILLLFGLVGMMGVRKKFS